VLHYLRFCDNGHTCLIYAPGAARAIANCMGLYWFAELYRRMYYRVGAHYLFNDPIQYCAEMCEVCEFRSAVRPQFR